MSFSVWHRRVIKKITPPSELHLYVRVFIFGLLIAAIFYWYTTWLKVPNPLNKAFDDTSITVIGLSMLLSSVCYFWDFMDTKIIYRKHLGLVGLAFGLTHIFLSFGVFTRLFTSQAWQQGIPYGPVTGVLATIIFAIMAIASNQYAAHVLGGVSWRKMLRTGYLGVVLIWLHVFFLKWVYVSDGLGRNENTAIFQRYCFTVYDCGNCDARCVVVCAVEKKAIEIFDPISTL